MGAFRKRDDLQPHRPIGLPGSHLVTVQVTKNVVTKDNPEPTVYVETVEKSVEDYAKSLGLPKDEDYQLRDMLAAGRVPEEVNVRGMLDSQDPTDLSNVGVGDAMFEQLSSQVKEPAKPAEPAPSNEPSNE